MRDKRTPKDVCGEAKVGHVWANYLSRAAPVCLASTLCGDNF